MTDVIAQKTWLGLENVRDYRNAGVRLLATVLTCSSLRERGRVGAMIFQDAIHVPNNAARTSMMPNLYVLYAAVPDHTPRASQTESSVSVVICALEFEESSWQEREEAIRMATPSGLVREWGQ